MGLTVPATGRTGHRPWRPAVLAAALALVLWGGAQLAFQHYLAAGENRAAAALRLTVNALQADLARYEVVPQLVGEFDLIHQLAARPDDPSLRRQTNEWLAEQNRAVQASDIYLVLPDGETVAHSTPTGPQSFIGQNFSYRPYFIDAMQGLQGRFYGVGTTSGVRGYFFSAPVRDDAGRITAVVAVKIGVDRIEASWRGGEFRMLVTDPDGAVFLSSEPGWLYHSLEPLTPERLARSATSRRYAETPLTEFPLERRVEHGVPLLRLPEAGTGTRDYVIASEAMSGAGWTVHVLLDSADLRAEAKLAVLGLVLFLSAAGFGAMMWRQRRVQAEERRAMERFAHAELERRVIERTAALALANDRLEQEIAERRATEAELRAAQASLVQVGKLAALGQMSASLSHEINQPLAAARNYADSAQVLIERGELARARENIGQILLLVDRMAAIGRHLRQAARKPDDRLGAVALAPLLEETRIIVAARLAASGAELELDLPATLPPLRAGPTRLQQVLVNLISNAADAAETAADRRITVSARSEGGHVEIVVRDRGAGIPQAIEERIFDPFFTTKGVGAGLGLGLSITANIVRDFGGEITCRNREPGAEFRIRLHVAESAGVAA